MSALSVQTSIETRRSVRRFTHEPIPEHDLHELLRLAGLAPSAWNAQPWRFAVVQTPELKERLQSAAYGQSQITSAPAVIVVYSDMEDALKSAEDTAHPGMGEAGRTGARATFDSAFGSLTPESRGQWGLNQTNIAFGFLMLAARSLGYDSVPMLGFDPVRVRELLGLPEHVQFAGLLPIGVAAEEGYPHHRHPTDKISTFL